MITETVNTNYENSRIILHVEKQTCTCTTYVKIITSLIEIINRNYTISNKIKDKIRRKLSEIKSFAQLERQENTNM